MKVRFAVAPGGGSQAPEQLGEFVDALEALRFDTVWLSDLPIGAIGDPLLGLTFAAARTARLKLGANVVPLGRNPYRFAKELAQIDQLSGGRLLLSFVPGVGTDIERETLGFKGVNRGTYLERIIPAVRQWWSGEPATFEALDGAGDSNPPIALEIRPVQQPLEIWLGGRGPRALERVGRLADGWLGGLTMPNEAGEARRAIVAAATAAGRTIDPEHFGVGISYSRTEPDPGVLEAVRARLAPGASLDDVVPVGRDALRRRIDDLVAEGMSKFVVRSIGPTAGETTSIGDELAWLADSVFPLQS